MPVEPNMYDDEKLASIRKEQKDPIILYFIVNDELNMGPGKVAAQCAHAAQMMLLRYFDIKSHMGIPCGGKYYAYVQLIDSWMQESFRKVVLKANKEEFNNIKEELDCFLVKDAGLTEVDPGSETVLALFPMYKSKAPDVIKKLRCY